MFLITLIPVTITIYFLISMLSFKFLYSVNMDMRSFFY